MIIKEWTSQDYFNFNDMNRIESNIENCYERIKLVTKINPISIKKNRTTKSIDTYKDFNRIESNLKIILESYDFEERFWDEPKTDWKAFAPVSYKDINRIEQTIKFIDKVVDYISNKNSNYTGEIYTNEIRKGDE